MYPGLGGVGDDEEEGEEEGVWDWDWGRAVFGVWCFVREIRN